MGSISGMVSGLIGLGQKLPTLDLAALYDTIKNAGTEQRALINALPPEIQKNLQEYAAKQDAAGATYQTRIEDQGQKYLDQIKGLYGPDSDAAKAENVADRMQIYSTVPGSQNAIRAALAASGGLGRGNAGVALAEPYLQAAQQYGQSAANVNARQTQQQQQATQQALQTVNTMETGMFQDLFGMSKDQAKVILTTGNAALADQLSALINESVGREGAMLDLQGAEAMKGYQNAVTRNQQHAAVWNGLASPFTNLADSTLQGVNNDAQQGASGWIKTLMGSGGGSSGYPGMDTGSSGYLRNAGAMAQALGA